MTEILIFLLGIAIGLIAFRLFFRYQQDKLSVNIKSAIDDNFKQVLDLLNQENQRFYQQIIKLNSSEISRVVQPLNMRLQDYQKAVNEIFQQNTRFTTALEQQILHLQQTQKDLSQQTRALVEALKNPTIRAKFGEIQVKNIIEKVGLTNYIDFVAQKTITVQDRRIRPDFIVNLPNGKRIVIDSKFSLDNFLKAYETEDLIKRERYFNEFIKNLENQINTLSRKNYHQAFGEIEFTVLFLNIENALTVALSRKPQLFDEALEKKIVIATPFTLFSLLHVISLEWQNYSITQNAKSIFKTYKELANNINQFITNLQNFSKYISKLTDEYEKLMKIWQKNIDPTLKKFESYKISEK